MTYIEQNLSDESKILWKKRGQVDHIVLLDWNSTLSQVTIATPLRTLKDALFKVCQEQVNLVLVIFFLEDCSNIIKNVKLGHIFIVLINIRGFSLHKHKNVGVQIESKVFIATFVIYARNVMLKDDNEAFINP